MSDKIRKINNNVYKKISEKAANLGASLAASQSDSSHCLIRDIMSCQDLVIKNPRWLGPLPCLSPLKVGVRGSGGAWALPPPHCSPVAVADQWWLEVRW